MVDQPVKYVVEEVNSAYMSYLAQLEERNRQKQMIHKKSEEILRRERLEQGFQLYFNIVNANQNATHKNRHTNSNLKTSRSRSANLSDKHPSQRTKSAPNPPNQRRIRKAWGEFNGFDLCSNQKPIPKSNSTIGPSDDLISETVSGSKSPSGPFPYPSTKNMHCRPRKLQNDSTIEDIVCFDRDESSISELNQSSLVSVELTEIFRLQIDVYSNWGDKNWVGLSGLELDDHSLGKIIHFQLYEVLKLDSDGILTSPVKLCHEENIFKEPFQTSDPKFMCFTSVDNLPLRINVKCLMNSDDRINQDRIVLRLWNYNDPKFPGIGVKDCLIKLKSNGRTHILFNGFLDKISSDRLTDIPKVIDCNLKDSTFSPTTALVRENHERLPNTSDSQISCFHDPVEIWSDNAQPKNWRYLRKVDPFLSDADEDLSSLYPSKSANEPETTKKSRIRSLLEESWNSLKFFNHFHAGRINLEEENCLKPSAPVQNDSSLWLDEIRTEPYSSAKFERPNFQTKLQVEEAKSITTLVQSKLYLTNNIGTDKIVCPERFTEPITIPVLPFGYTLILDIVSTWGDIYYVGLTGIEIFTMDGINVAPFCKISANPADINILPGYSDDPRVISNLIDGVNWTRDDIHMWLAPFSLGNRHLIQINLPSWTKPIAMLRIWNYNKSRVHASRGVREILIYLDSKPIFRGEISKALGLEFGEPEDFSETILFCTDNDILERIGKNDQVLRLRNSLVNDIESVVSHLDERPKTSVQQDMKQITNENSPELMHSSESVTKLLNDLNLKDKQSLEELWVEIELLKPWNENTSFIGLTEIQILDSNMEQIKLNHVAVNGKCIPNSDPVYRLFNGNFHTCNPEDMWFTEFRDTQPLKLRIYVSFDSTRTASNIAKLRIWNYNDPHIEMDYSCKLIRIHDSQGRTWTQNPNSDVILLRRGPGHTKFAFGQIIQLDKDTSAQYLSNGPLEVDTTGHFPSGFVYQLNMFSSWYDQFYVGLDGLELIGSNGLPIDICMDQIFASPSSVNDLNTNTYLNRSDIRTVDKLVDGVNEGLEMNYHCWLSPILPDRMNQVFIVFDRPVHAIGLRLWNYTRTPERGVRELAVLLDDRLIFRGYLPKYQRLPNDDGSIAKQTVQGILPNCEQRCTNNGRNHYYVIPLNLEAIEKFEDSKYILDNSKTYLSDERVKLINIDSSKPNGRFGFADSHLRLRPNINQTLRPQTCISNQQMITTL